MNRRVAVAAVLGLVVAACSGSDTDELVLPNTETPTTEASATSDVVDGTDAPETAPSTEATTSTSTTSTTTTTEVPEPPIKEATELWIEAWQIASRGYVTPADFEGVATERAATDIIALLNLAEGESRTITNNPVPVLEDQIPDAIFFDDCMHLDPYPTDETTHWYTGTVEPSNGELLVTVVNATLYTGCVPATIAEAVLADYEDSIRAINEYWRPADPDHPRLFETTTGPRLTLMRNLLAEHQRDGIEFRGGPEIHPEVAKYEPNRVVILDCALRSPAYGLYSTETGLRLPETPQLPPQTRSLTSSIMLFENGRWKDSDQNGATEADCDFAPTSAGVAIV